MPLSVTAKGLLTTMGGILIHLTLGTIYSISNMNTYIISYLHVIRGVVWLPTASPPSVGHQRF